MKLAEFEDFARRVIKTETADEAARMIAKATDELDIVYATKQFVGRRLGGRSTHDAWAWLRETTEEYLTEQGRDIEEIIQ